MAGNNTQLADAMAIRTAPEANPISANNPNPEASNKTDALARVFAQIAETNEPQEKEAFTDTQNPAEGFDSPEVQQETLAHREENEKLEGQRASLEESITLYDAEANRLKAFDMEQSKRAREGLQLIINQNKQLKQSPEIARAVSGQLTNTSIEAGGGQGHKVHDAGLTSRMQQLIERHKNSKMWMEAFNKKDKDKKKTGPGAGMAEAKGHKLTTKIHEVDIENSAIYVD